MRKFRIALGGTAVALASVLALGLSAAPADAAQVHQNTRPVLCCS